LAVTDEIGPGLRKWQLATTLAQLRTSAGVDVGLVAARLGCSRARVNHLETGRNLPHKTDIIVLAEMYGVPDREDELIALWEAASAKGWWDSFRLPRETQKLIGLENDAIRIRCWTLEVVPGLGQTEDYARHLLVARHHPPEGAERGVRVRMERQRNLDRGQILTMVFSEAMLHRTAAMGDVGRGQLIHLIKMADRVNVQLRVVPFNMGAHWGMSGGFTLMDFPPDLLPTVAYRQGAAQSDLTDDTSSVALLEAMYAMNLESSLDQPSTVELIEGVLQGMGPAGSIDSEE